MRQLTRPEQVEGAAADLRSELIAAEREYIYRLLREGKITDEARRRIERELDLEEAGIGIQERGRSGTSALGSRGSRRVGHSDAQNHPVFAAALIATGHAAACRSLLSLVHSCSK